MSIKSAASEKLNTVSTKAAKAAAKVIQPHLESPKTAFEEMQDAVNAARARYFAEVNAPSWTRTVASWVCAILAGCTVYYWGLTLANIVLASVAMLTGIGFITFVLAVLSMLVIGFGAVAAGTAAYGFAQSIDVTAIKSRVTGWFKRGDAEPAAA